MLALTLVLAAFLLLVPAREAAAGTATGCGTVLVAGSDWLGGKGVDVRSNGVGWIGSCAGGSAGYGWQCVDLAYRLYQKMGWGHIHAGGNGGAAYLPRGSTGVVFHRNGTYLPVPGDLVIEGPTGSNAYGHVAVVNTVQGTTIHAVEQNTQHPVAGKWVDHPRHEYRLAGLSISGGYGPVSGVLHSPKNTLSNAHAPTPTPTPHPTPAPQPASTPAPASGLAGIAAAASRIAEAAAKAIATPAPTAVPPSGVAYRTTAEVSVHSGPGTGYGGVGSIPSGRSIIVVCQALGTSVNGSRIWDELSTGGWVTDYYVNTPVFNAFTPGLRRC